MKEWRWLRTFQWLVKWWLCYFVDVYILVWFFYSFFFGGGGRRRRKLLGVYSTFFLSDFKLMCVCVCVCVPVYISFSLFLFSPFFLPLSLSGVEPKLRNPLIHITFVHGSILAGGVGGQERAKSPLTPASARDTRLVVASKDLLLALFHPFRGLSSFVLGFLCAAYFFLSSLSLRKKIKKRGMC